MNHLKRAQKFRKNLEKKVYSLAQKIAEICPNTVEDLDVAKIREIDLPSEPSLWFLLVVKDGKPEISLAIEDYPLKPAYDAELSGCYIEEVAEVADNLKKILRRKRAESLKDMFLGGKPNLKPGLSLIKSLF